MLIKASNPHSLLTDECVPASSHTCTCMHTHFMRLKPLLNGEKRCCNTCPRQPACLSVCVFIRPLVSDLAPAHSQSISSPINGPTCQENRWSPLTEVLLLRSAANNAVLSVRHSGRFTPAFSHQSLLYQPQPQGAGRPLRSCIVHVGFVGRGWFTRILLCRVMTYSYWHFDINSYWIPGGFITYS